MSTWSGTTRTHAHFSSLSLPPYFGNNNNSLLRSSLPRSSRVSLIRPPLLRLLLLISTVCNATAFSQARRAHAQQALLGAGRDNSTHKERHDGKLLLLPAELLVYWRLSTYQSLREKHICGKAETTRTALPQFLAVPATLTGPKLLGRSRWSCPGPALCRTIPENNERVSRYLGCLGRHT